MSIYSCHKISKTLSLSFKKSYSSSELAHDCSDRSIHESLALLALLGSADLRRLSGRLTIVLADWHPEQINSFGLALENKVLM